MCFPKIYNSQKYIVDTDLAVLYGWCVSYLLLRSMVLIFVFFRCILSTCDHESTKTQCCKRTLVHINFRREFVIEELKCEAISLIPVVTYGNPTC